ncbi:hypothetical protein FE257_004789 [Aspergillus nanangensis]|uniref:Zn(2)-C6 fungal-type domain-containing protein n=1 Tax=Aspergillus nanangensis TaxID=2582783 RepID=A0AAD4CR91_ASPNN|nr:hypothetical protein FE257_004789 [Aspergillus nanangensis]
MSRKFKVRFAPALPVQDNCQLPPQPRVQLQEHRRSRSGCRDCRRRHVKCDETFPVCLRCQKRGTPCQAVQPPPKRWEMEVPSLFSSNITKTRSTKHTSLLHHWCQRASQIMVLDPDLNPFSFALVQYFDSSPSLLHTVLSISAGHQHFFQTDGLGTCLEERSVALAHLRQEIDTLTETDHIKAFMCIFMLGVSTPWIDEQQCQFGREHLTGARTLINLIIASPTFADNTEAKHALGTYLYWDMACSFLLEPGQQLPSNNSPEIYTAMQKTVGIFHPIMGYTVELMYLLGNLGRYCRTVVDLGIRDETMEHAFEEQLLAWEPSRENHELGLLADSLKHHGLINLYRICGRPSSGVRDDDVLFEEEDVTTLSDDHLLDTIDDFVTDEIIRQYAIRTVQDLTAISTTNWHINLQGIPLLTAGSELTAADTEERALVVERFNALYSVNRIPANLLVIELVEELWEARDAGVTFSWLQLMLQKGWRLMLG